MLTKLATLLGESRASRREESSRPRISAAPTDADDERRGTVHDRWMWQVREEPVGDQDQRRFGFL
jgi:hypothetical protein